MNRFKPSPLLKPKEGVTYGPDKEAIHSVYKRLCEHNQLSVSAVWSELTMPVVCGVSVRQRKMAQHFNLLSRGGDWSDRVRSWLSITVGMEGLENLTLDGLIRLRGIGTLPSSKYRKWCPECYSSDIETDIGPYDRLLWSIRDVNACPVHRVKLESICPYCGADNLPVLSGRDLPGRCPKCLGWLGYKSTGLVNDVDDYARWSHWIAKSFADLLAVTFDADADVSENVNNVIRAVVGRQYKGQYAHFAKAIRRNRSVVGTWLTGRGFPSWEAVCEISYVFQLPMLEILTGKLDAIEFSSVIHLPQVSSRRFAHPRKLPKKRDIDEIRAFLVEVERGERPSVLTIAETANRLGIHPRDLRRRLPDEVGRLSKILQERRQAQQKRKALDFEEALRKEIPIIVSRLLASGLMPSRRAICQGLAVRGLSVGRRQGALVKELTDTACFLSHQQNSGNK